MNRVVARVQEVQLRKGIPHFRPGDTVRVHVRLKEAEGEKERIQPFEGVVIRKRGSLAGASFTVRRVSFGIGIERIFPINSPTISSIDVVSQGPCDAPSSTICAGARARPRASNKPPAPRASRSPLPPPPDSLCRLLFPGFILFFKGTSDKHR